MAGGIRREPTYLSYEVYRVLRLLAKAKSDASANHIVTADELADKMLGEVILQKHPEIIEYTKQIDKLERELLKTL